MELIDKLWAAYRDFVREAVSAGRERSDAVPYFLAWLESQVERFEK